LQQILVANFFYFVFATTSELQFSFLFLCATILAVGIYFLRIMLLDYSNFFVHQGRGFTLVCLVMCLSIPHPTNFIKTYWTKMILQFKRIILY
jgi:hypothetical protein